MQKEQLQLIKCYMAMNNLSIAELSRQVGVCRTYLSRILHGHLRPSLPVATQLEGITRGIIKATDICSRKKYLRKKPKVHPRPNKAAENP